MAWVKIDDRLHGHPKARAAGPAMELWVLALSWSACYGTDGRLPGDLPSILLGLRGDSLAITLVTVGLWARATRGGVYVIRNFLKFNPSRAEVEQRRATEKARQKRHREGLSRRDTRVTPGRDGPGRDGDDDDVEARGTNGLEARS